MKICLVSQEYPPESARGGIGSQTWNKARTFTELGHDVSVLCASARQDLATRSENVDGVRVRRLPTPGTLFPVYEQATYWMGYSWAVFSELRLLSREVTFDIIDFAEYGAEGYAYLLDRNDWNRVPVAVQLHGPLAMFAERIGWPELTSDLYRVGSSMEEYCIQRADALMACSANIADFTARRHGVARDRIAVVHCGVDVHAFAARGERASRPTVLFVGNVVANKGVLTVFEAVMRLRARHPDIVLKVLGKDDGELSGQLQRRAADLGASDNIQFCGFVGRDELPAFFREAWVFASPAPHEVGVANVYIEAMASGCPVVACDTGGAPEAVEQGRSGFLVRPSDVDGTAQAIGCLLDDAALRDAMGASGRARALDYFAMEHYGHRVLNVYTEAIENSRRKAVAR